MADLDAQASLQDEYRTVETEFWERNDYRTQTSLSSRSQFYEVFSKLIRKIRNSALEEKLPQWEYEERLAQAESILDDVAFALKYNWRDAPAHAIWYFPSLDTLQDRPDNLKDASPISIESLDRATVEYLNSPWMQLNQIDWYILNAFVFDETAKVMDAFKSGQAIGKINWAYIFSEGQYEKTLWLNILFSMLKFIARWVLFPVAIGGLYYFGYENAAMWIILPYSIYIGIHIILFPKRYMQRKKLTKKIEDIQKNLNKLINVFQSVNVDTINPSRLRDLIARAEEQEVFFRPAVYSVLDRAIARDPAVFTIGE